MYRTIFFDTWGVKFTECVKSHFTHTIMKNRTHSSFKITTKPITRTSKRSDREPINTPETPVQLAKPHLYPPPGLAYIQQPKPAADPSHNRNLHYLSCLSNSLAAIIPLLEHRRAKQTARELLIDIRRGSRARELGIFPAFRGRRFSVCVCSR